MDVNSKVFRAYDIRGLYDSELDRNFAFALGDATAKFLLNQKPANGLKIVIGHDARPFSALLKDYLIAGFLYQKENNVSVIDLGLVSTPMHFFITNKSKVDGGVMITASHSPKEYAGFKIYGPNANPISLNSGLSEIRNLMSKSKQFDIKYHPEEDSKIWQKSDKLDEYVNFLFKSVFKLSRPCSIVVDAGNGSMGPIIEKIAQRVGFGLIPLFFKPDGAFPNRSPNPLEPMALEPLKEKIKKSAADFGVAFDGDGDRIVFIDEKSQIIKPEYIFALLAEETLKENAGSKVVIPVNVSQIIKETILKNHGQPIISQIGRTFLIQNMRKHKAVLGGEISGHYYFQEFFGGDTGILTMLKVLKIFSKATKPFSALFKPYEKYYKSEELNFKVNNWPALRQRLEEKYYDAPQIEKIDGLTFRYADWWFNIRPSNTEALMRLVVETDNEKLLQQEVGKLSDLINNLQVVKK